jgi:hypothetical protein
MQGRIVHNLEGQCELTYAWGLGEPLTIRKKPWVYINDSKFQSKASKEPHIH